MAVTGVGKSSTLSRRACRSAVSTSGRGPSGDVPGSRTTAIPANLPAGTSITSPRWSPSRECDHLLATVGLAGPGRPLLELGEPVAEPGVLHEVAAVAGGRLGVPLEGVLGLAQLPGQADDRLVRLELRERRLQQLAGAVAGRTGAPG